MKMTPHKILLALGFDVPEQGIKVNEHDAFFHAESLRLLGNTISIDRIDNSALAGLVAAHRGEEAVPASEQTAERVKALIRANCNVTYKLNSKSQA